MTGLELAGLVAPDGSFPWTGDGMRLIVPKDIKLRRQGLFWRDGTLPFDRVAVTPNLLGEFLKLGLSDSTGEDVLVFAQRWGVIGICEHGFPHSHAGCDPFRV